MTAQKEMKVKDIPTGKIFTIEETPSYPKLKLSVGYIDMRDKILGHPENTDFREARIMDMTEMCERFGAIPNEIDDWVAELSKQTNP